MDHYPEFRASIISRHKDSCIGVGLLKGYSIQLHIDKTILPSQWDERHCRRGKCRGKTRQAVDVRHYWTIQARNQEGAEEAKSPVYFFVPSAKMYWTSFETIGHGLKIWAPLRKFFAPRSVPSWLRAWVSLYVVALKQDGDVSVCVDLMRANEGIVRERHQCSLLKTCCMTSTAVRCSASCS